MPARFHALITNFIFGETSPRVAARVSGDQIFGMNAADVYRSGCRECTNMIVLPQGGAYKREGFKFGRDITLDIPTAPQNSLSFRLFTLRSLYSDVLLVMSPGEAWVYQLPNFQVVGFCTTPYTPGQLANIGIAQFEDNVVVYSESHRPRRLTFKDGVVLIDPGADFIAPLYTYGDTASPIPQTGTVTVAFEFAAGDTSSQFLLQVSNVSAVSPTTGRAILATAYLANDPATVNSIETAMGYISAVVPGSAVCTHVSTAGQVATFSIDYSFYSNKGDGTGLFACVPFLSSTKVTTTVEADPNGDAEPLWSGPFALYHNGIWWECIASHIAAALNEPGVGADFPTYWVGRGTTPPIHDYDLHQGSWEIDQAYSPRGRGWPAHMGFHEQRLVGSGPPDAGSVVAASTIINGNDLFDFTLGVNDADGLLFRLTGADNAIIRWLYSAQYLFVGTSAGVYAQLARPWTPTNVSFIRINGYNTSVGVHAVEVDGDLFFPTVDDRQIRQVQFSNDLQTWQSWDLTSFAEHLFTPNRRLKQLAAFQSTETYLWAVRTDGALMGMSYAPSQTAYHALAWHKHSVSDPVLQIATAFDGNNTVLVALVNRWMYDAASGAFVHKPSLEVMEHSSQNLFDAEVDFFENSVDLDAPLKWRVVPYPGRTWSVHLDSHVQLTGNGGGVLTVPERLAGRVVQAVEDGAYLGQFIVSATGTINVETVAGSTVYVGFGYTSRIEPNRLESQSAMTTQSHKQRWVKPVMRLLTSAMPLLNGSRPNERTQDDFYDVSTGLFTGDVYVANYGSDGRLVIEQDLPLPLHLTGIFGLMTTEEG